MTENSWLEIATNAFQHPRRTTHRHPMPHAASSALPTAAPAPCRHSPAACVFRMAGQPIVAQRGLQFASSEATAAPAAPRCRQAASTKRFFASPGPARCAATSHRIGDTPATCSREIFDRLGIDILEFDRSPHRNAAAKSVEHDAVVIIGTGEARRGGLCGHAFAGRARGYALR